ncbi:MAG: DNA mismatch repair protein MutL, partial [Oscillospiraceae bacterium]
KNDVSLRVVGEIFSTYIVTERGNEMCLIDKHAAHERMIYEELMLNYGEVASQMLLAPVTATLSAEEKNALMQNETILAKSGIEIEDFGGMSVLVRAVPTDVVPDSVESLIVELAHSLLTGNKNTMAEKTQWVLHSIACRAAIKAGDKSRETELLRLAQEVLDGEIPPFCPHGRPIVLRLTRKELEKQFGRQ